MAAIISTQDVNDFYYSGKSDFVIQSVIQFIDGADDCLDAAGISEDQQTLLKIYAVCHQLTLMSGGQVTSERAMTGDSVSYAAPATSTGLGSTSWGAMLKSMPGSDCIETLLNKSDIQVFSVGRRCS
jgi:hypothetical protein